MSYIICSNGQSEQDINIGGFSEPSSFVNHFKSPLQILPDSEIAIESVKIDRGDEWSIKETDVFYLYFGPEQIDGTDFVNSGDVTKNGVKIMITPGSYTKEGFAKALAKAINNSPISPEIFGNCNVSTLTDATTNKFDGFKFSITARSGGTNVIGDEDYDLVASNLVDANSATIAYNNDPANIGGGATAYSYDPVTHQITCNVDGPTDKFYNQNKRLRSNCSVMIQHPLGPLSANNGEFICNFVGLQDTESFAIGLTRPYTPYWRGGFPSIYLGPPNERPGPTSVEGRSQLTMMDFWMQYDFDNEVLQLFTWGYTEGQDNWNVKEIKYYEAAANSDYGAIITRAKITADNLVSVKFLLDGNELRVKLIDNVGAETVLVDTATSAVFDRRYNFPPLSNPTEALIPVISLTEDSQTVTLEHYSVNADEGMVNWKYPSSTNTSLDRNFRPDRTAGLIPGSDWYTNSEMRNDTLFELKYNQTRPSILWSNSGEYGDYKYSNMTGTVNPYVPILITGPEVRDPSLSDYIQKLYVIPQPNNEANMSRTLGFGLYNVITYSDFGGGDDTDNDKTLQSIEAGNFTVHSCFVRVNDLPIQSYNGATSSRSNILYHIPRFSNDGKQFGEMYFPVPEKTYIALNNTDTITLSQLKVDIVGRNERVVSDLVGATIVCFHIRQRRK